MNTQGNIPLFETTITKVMEIAPNVYVLSFPKTDDFRPGQMLALALKSTDQARLYSIASGKDDADYRILFNIMHKGFLTPRLSKVNPGDHLFISKPFGSFYGTMNPDWWIAAGTGIAPFISMLESGMGENKTLIHGGRAANSFYYSETFRKKLKDNYLKCSSLERKEGFYQGRITSFLRKTEKLNPDGKYFVCGSSEFVVDVRDILISRAIPYQQIIAEIYF